jgi:outer membrane protein
MALTVVACGALAATPARAELKIGIVDYNRLAAESPQAKAISEALRAEFSPRERDLQNAQNSLKAKEDKLQKDAATMTDEQKARADKDLRDGLRDLQRRQQEAQDDLNSRRNEELSRLQRVLIEQVRTYAKAQNFDLVIAEGVIYNTPAIDITPAILTALNAGKPAAAVSAAKPAGAAPAAPKPAGK